jgi:hypothetical protein
MMLKLHAPDGREIYLAPDAVAEVTEAGASSQWHGIRARIRTFDGRVIEVQETAREVAQAIAVTPPERNSI